MESELLSGSFRFYFEIQWNSMNMKNLTRSSDKSTAKTSLSKKSNLLFSLIKLSAKEKNRDSQENRVLHESEADHPLRFPNPKKLTFSLGWVTNSHLAENVKANSWIKRFIRICYLNLSPPRYTTTRESFIFLLTALNIDNFFENWGYAETVWSIIYRCCDLGPVSDRP